MYMDYVFLGVFCFAVTAALVPLWSAYCRKNGIMAEDKHKPGRSVAEWGGLVVSAGFAVGLAGILVFGQAKYMQGGVVLLSVLASLVMALLIGLSDDIFWKSAGKRYYKVILSLLIPLPVMLVLFERSHMYLPALGEVNIGLFYPLIIVPFAVVIAANSFNMLAGYNGLEAGMGILIISVLAFASGPGSIAFSFGLCAVAAIAAFMMFNWYPASIFPGNSFTYFTGSCAAIVALLGGVEVVAAVLFIPYVFEFVLKLRGGFRKESFGSPTDDGITLQYRKFYGLEHMAIAIIRKLRGKALEWEVTVLLLSFELLFVAAALVFVV
ncbi:hypothetical protein KY363_04425 [Candidatus Woesearchaeota archaeon]|nr:hypothetical protein [Candidatus Woesearchaeota archaeon]